MEFAEKHNGSRAIPGQKVSYPAREWQKKGIEMTRNFNHPVIRVMVMMLESWLLVSGSQMRGVRLDGSSIQLPEISIATDNSLNFPSYLYPVDHLPQ